MLRIEVGIKGGISLVRNVCLLAHGNAGKTSLVEAMLHEAGASERFGRVEEGTTVTDFDPEEIKRKFSISTAIANFQWKNTKFNMIDTPGYFDFVGEVMQGLRVADGAIVVVSAKSGVSVGTENAWKYCLERNLARIVFINKIDSDSANFTGVLEQLRERFGNIIVPFQLPIKEGEHITGVVDLVEMHAKKFDGDKLIEIEIPSDIADEVAAAREMIIESVAETDEKLMERFFNGDTFSDAEIKTALHKGVSEMSITPVLCGSAVCNIAISLLMDAVCAYLPSPEERPTEIGKNPNGDDVEVKPLASEPLRALVFKTVADPFVGKLSYFKVISGEMTADMSIVNANNGSIAKIGHIYFVNGKKQIETKKVTAGDIGALTKLATTKTGDTLCSVGSPVILKGIDFPKPTLSMAVYPKAKGDEEKIAAGLNKLMEEDQTFKLENNHETHEMILKGIGEQHLDILASKLKAKFAVDLYLKEPKVPYREAIRKHVKVEGKHKKQSGGHGQYGHVWIEFEPGEGEGLTFEEKVFGGSVPRNYFPAIEKGLQDCLHHGVLAGYPVVNLKAVLVDGSYHPVDSSEMAFKMAATLAYKKGLAEASPVILEPIGHLVVTIPDSYMGDIIGDINKRRGRVLGMNPIGDGLSQVEADVPLAEAHKYATDLRSMSQARGTFQFEFARYEDAPANVAEKVIEEAKAAKELES